MTIKRIEQIKQAFNMQPHPEGGFYSEQYRSKDIIKSPKNAQDRDALSHIYFLLTISDISRWHKVIHDEIWHVYEGDPLRILSFDDRSGNDTKNAIVFDETIGKIGSEITTHYYKVIQGGQFQAAQSTGQYTLLGCCVAPGFVFDDFSYIENEPTKKWVIEQGKDYAKFL
ncbi:MAG: putative cupin superfamily sugar epimerase [Patiriisocius sp.]|jgi:predicted cupin superfamily sugar epimerase